MKLRTGYGTEGDQACLDWCRACAWCLMWTVDWFGIKLTLHGALFWICDRNNVADTLQFEPQLSSECTMLRPFLLLSLAPVSKLGTQDARKGIQPGQLSLLGIAHPSCLLNNTTASSCSSSTGEASGGWWGAIVVFCITCSVLFCFPYS